MGLREQKRFTTLQEIQCAALDLVEEQGLFATTVGQISARAGISERTFFRYYPTKEHALLPAQQHLVDCLAAHGILATDAPGALQEMVALYRLVFVQEIQHREFRRISRLLIQEPELGQVVARQERLFVEDLNSALDNAGTLNPIQAMLVAEIATSVWRVAWTSFAKKELSGQDPDPIALFDQTAEELSKLQLGHWSR